MEEVRDMLEYEFERVEACESGYSLFGGVGLRIEEHREIICRRAAEGWTYAGFVPTAQRAAGFIDELDLIFVRETGKQ
jgi:hypothetical protein